MQIRFFERVKLERRIKHLQRQLQSEHGDAGNAEQQAAELHQAQEDLQVGPDSVACNTCSTSARNTAALPKQQGLPAATGPSWPISPVNRETLQLQCLVLAAAEIWPAWGRLLILQYRRQLQGMPGLPVSGQGLQLAARSLECPPGAPKTAAYTVLHDCHALACSRGHA